MSFNFHFNLTCIRRLISKRHRKWHRNGFAYLTRRHFAVLKIAPIKFRGSAYIFFEITVFIHLGIHFRNAIWNRRVYLIVNLIASRNILSIWCCIGNCAFERIKLQQLTWFKFKHRNTRIPRFSHRFNIYWHRKIYLLHSSKFITMSIFFLITNSHPLLGKSRSKSINSAVLRTNMHINMPTFWKRIFSFNRHSANKGIITRIIASIIKLKRI